MARKRKHKQNVENVKKFRTENADDDPYYCKECNKSFSRKSGKRQHDVSIHSEPDILTNYNCSMCQQRFSTEVDLVNHLHQSHAIMSGYKSTESALGRQYVVYSKDFNHSIEMTEDVPPFQILCSEV